LEEKHDGVNQKKIQTFWNTK